MLMFKFSFLDWDLRMERAVNGSIAKEKLMWEQSNKSSFDEISISIENVRMDWFLDITNKLGVYQRLPEGSIVSKIVDDIYYTLE